MKATNGNRKHIGIFGNTNAGKSSIINKLTGQDVSIVSDIKGTTTDTVKKAMELLPVGPVLFIDTAGLDDSTDLREERLKRTNEALMKTDVAIFVFDAQELDFETFNKWSIDAKKYNVPYLVVVNKAENLSDKKTKVIKEKLKNVIFTSIKEDTGFDFLNDKLIKILEVEEEDRSLIADLVPYGGSVILVVPIDSEAPKGRLILPQVQLIRDCLDNGIKSYVVRDTELEEALKDLTSVDLVVTDSQAFKKVSGLVPKNIRLTSFSILFARQKGDINEFIDGVNSIRTLKPNSKVLVAESCTHNVSHEDIARVKIPTMLKKYVGGELEFTFVMGNDFSNNLEEYDLVIHCGACMVNRKTVVNRIRECKDKEVKITNFGIVLAFLTGILDRATLNL